MVAVVAVVAVAGGCWRLLAVAGGGGRRLSCAHGQANRGQLIHKHVTQPETRLQRSAEGSGINVTKRGENRRREVITHATQEETGPPFCHPFT